MLEENKVCKIFISYNHSDQQVIDKIANDLAITFGQNNIFYDAWSIQPGDSIIGKMNEGLTEFTTFFLFVSNNSLNSKMVSLEWQTALHRSVNENLNFVCVRISDCDMPTILSDKSYIDLYNEGVNIAIKKMKSKATNQDFYMPLKNFNNCFAKIVDKTVKQQYFEITFYAKQFVEQDPVFGIGCGLSKDDFSLVNLGPLSYYDKNVLTLQDKTQLQIRTVSPAQSIKPNFPYSVGLSIEHNKRISINDIVVYRQTDAEQDQWTNIEIQFI